jgi:glucuronate isomerase
VKPFIHPDFLLESDTARALYHEHARGQPIIDYHCHLSPAAIAENRRFRSLTELWLDGDHYKWRAMRADGVPEKYCTGGASDWEKFQAWANTVPHTLRNPLYHWTHLELAFPFGITDRLLDGNSARAIYDECNARLDDDRFRAAGLLEQFNVLVVCTTDDPTDSLAHHRAHRASSCQLLPTWRPDRALQVDAPAQLNPWLDTLEQAADTSVGSFRDLLDALDRRHAFFHEAGCRLSDHGLETIHVDDCPSERAARLFDQVRAGRPLSVADARALSSALLHELAVMDHGRGWVQQYHLGALRACNTRLGREIGADGGFDTIGDENLARGLARHLDRLDRTDQLARTILYNLNPRDNELMVAMLGTFQDGSVPGKLQYGSAWWFLDQLSGMRRQLDALSNLGLLWRFVGMLTDSRSFLSYSRHDYFRRLLCQLLGDEVERGLLPRDLGLLGELVENVCFQNARAYFGFDLDAGQPAGND